MGVLKTRLERPLLDVDLYVKMVTYNKKERGTNIMAKLKEQRSTYIT